MASELNVAVATGLASALIGAAVTYVTTILKIRQDLEAKYDSDLRRHRIVAYKELWKDLQPLARYAPPGDFDAVEGKELATILRMWYFENGGLFLSETARDAYFSLQDELKTLAEAADQKLSPDLFERIKAKGSALRTRLSEDVGTRAKSMLHN